MSSCAKIMIPFTPMEPDETDDEILGLPLWAVISSHSKGQNCGLISASYLCTSCTSVHPRIRFKVQFLYQQHEWVCNIVATFINSNPFPPQKKHCEMSSSFSSKLCLQQGSVGCWISSNTKRSWGQNISTKRKLSIWHSVQKPYRHWCWNALTSRNFDAQQPGAREFHLPLW